MAALTAVWGQEKNLGVNKAVTAKIRAFDQGFFKGFDVYSAKTIIALLVNFGKSPSRKKRLSMPFIVWMINISIANIISPLSPVPSTSSTPRGRSSAMSIRA